MIREYTEADRDDLLRLIADSMTVLMPEDRDFIFRPSGQILVAEEDEGLTGFAGLGSWGENGENGKLYLCVAPRLRGRGIGTALYKAALDRAAGYKLVEAVFRTDEGFATGFFEKRGFQKWYGLHEMLYCGGLQPEPNEDIVPYDDSFFHDYIDGIRRSFYEMRRVHDFRPHYCMDFTEERRQELLADCDKLFVLRVDGRLAASAAVRRDSYDALGPVFTVPEFQGRGYGRRMTQFAINEALRQGISPLRLEVVEWNRRAEALYASLGFKTIEATASYRLFLK